MIKSYFLLITIVGIFFCVAPASLFCQDESKANQAKEILNEFKQMGGHTRLAEEWVPQLKELVDLGSDATLPLCDALKETENSFQMRVFAFAIRAIGDSRAVPTLIETVPKTLIGPSSDMGMGIDDDNLMKFMQKHDLDRIVGNNSFGLGRPCREVVGAIERLTSHKFEQSKLTSIMLGGGALHQYYQKKAYHDYAIFLKGWWENHYSDMEVDMDFIDVDLEDFELIKPKESNVFLTESAEVGMRIHGVILGPPSREQYASCFYDLDRGIRAKLGESYKGGADDLAAIEKWAIANDFDLMGMHIKMEGHDEPQYVIKALGMKFWQEDASLYSDLAKTVTVDDFELGEARHDLLVYFDAEKKQYDPDQQATFLYQTTEGTCGAILTVSQVTKLLDLAGPSRSISDIQDDEGVRLGVKINTKPIYSGK